MSFLYFVSFLAGTFAFMLDFVPLKACFPTDVSLVDLMVTLPSFLHPENALLPMVFKLDFDVLPKVAVVTLLQPENAVAPMVFTYGASDQTGDLCGCCCYGRTRAACWNR